jgi:hypothetical protein
MSRDFDADGGDACRLYTVEPGDNLYRIAEQFQTPLAALHDANPNLDVLQVRGPAPFLPLPRFPPFFAIRTSPVTKLQNAPKTAYACLPPLASLALTLSPLRSLSLAREHRRWVCECACPRLGGAEVKVAALRACLRTTR